MLHYQQLLLVQVEDLVLNKFLARFQTQFGYNPHSALQLLRHILVTKTRQFDDTTDRNSLIAVTQN